MITSKTFVRRTQWRIYGHGAHRGSGYCEENIDRQYLIKVWKLWGLPIWKRTLDSEDVPVYASAQKACFGYTDWKSKFAEYIT